MNSVEAEISAVGRAKTVLVFGEGPGAKAVITLLVVEWAGPRAAERLRFGGSLRFARETETHIAATILPAIDRLCELLGLEPGGFDVSGVNLGAASCHDIGIDVTGFSADLALFLALVSARLQLPLPQDVVCTGHLASKDGEVRLVRNLAVKLEAAKADPSIARFVYPKPDTDGSLAALAESELSHLREALANKGDLKTIPVRDVNQLLEAVISEEAVVLAALHNAYMGRRFARSVVSGPIDQASRFLGADTQQRFFDVLAAKFAAGDASGAVNLLERWSGFWVQHRRYPQGFGERLRRLIQSVPPSIRMRKLNVSLLSVSSCIKLSQCASSIDAQDVLELYRVVTGTAASSSNSQTAAGNPRGKCRKSRASTLDIVLAEIGQEHLTAVICLPIDTARASFPLDSVTAESPAHALEIITAFYIHLQFHTGRATGRLTFEEAGPKARALLERTFLSRGSVAAALAEAQSGTQGGLRFVLDAMTEQFKRECQEAHVLYVFASTLEQQDWSARVEFIKELFRRCSGMLPAELLSEPPERFARDYERIVRLYVNTLDNMKQVLRAL